MISRGLRGVLNDLDKAIRTIEEVHTAGKKSESIAFARSQIGALWRLHNALAQVSETPMAPTFDVRKTPADGSMDPDVIGVLENAVQTARSPLRKANPITGVLVCLAFKEPISGSTTAGLGLAQDRGLEELAFQAELAALSLRGDLPKPPEDVYARAAVRVKGLTRAQPGIPGLVVELDREDKELGLSSTFVGGTRFTIPVNAAEQKNLSARFGEPIELVLRASK